LVDGERLDPVDHLLTLVVPAPGVALRVLVRQHRPGCLENGLGDVVLRRDELDRVPLPPLFGGDELGDLRVPRAQCKGADRWA